MVLVAMTAVPTTLVLVGWLLTLPNHYNAHLGALQRGTKSAL